MVSEPGGFRPSDPVTVRSSNGALHTLLGRRVWEFFSANCPLVDQTVTPPRVILSSGPTGRTRSSGCKNLVGDCSVAISSSVSVPVQGPDVTPTQGKKSNRVIAPLLTTRLPRQNVTTSFNRTCWSNSKAGVAPTTVAVRQRCSKGMSTPVTLTGIDQVLMDAGPLNPLRIPTLQILLSTSKDVPTGGVNPAGKDKPCERSILICTSHCLRLLCLVLTKSLSPYS